MTEFGKTDMLLTDTDISAQKVIIESIVSFLFMLVIAIVFVIALIQLQIYLFLYLDMSYGNLTPHLLTHFY